MRSKLKIIISLFAFVFVGMLGFMGMKSHAAGITVTLEQQTTSDGDNIRYVSTMTNMTDLSEVAYINAKLRLTKSGEKSLKTTKQLTTVYTSVGGDNGKNAIDNTYYAVMTITDLLEQSGWTISCQFEYVYANGEATLSTNTVVHKIGGGLDLNTGNDSFSSMNGVVASLTANSIQEGTIFHAWNWSMNTIKANLQAIKAAGFTTVQTSPMQPQKDYWVNPETGRGNAQDGWWKVYQPLGFVIATKNNALGTKTEMASMIEAAHEIGLNVIVDVVSNHLAGSSTQLDEAVKEYEPLIYGIDGTISGGALLHNETSSSATDYNNTTNGNIGLPDLDTSNQTVQDRVASLLKEYLSIGVDGFRFDAAKHIETPTDSDSIKSDYWTDILTQANTYADDNHIARPYVYGEVLFGPGNGRSFSSYTSIMSVTDNVTGNNIREAINDGNAASAASNTYNSGQSANQLILWGESHDTYANDEMESTFVSQSVVDKAYAMVASRKGASSLYLARPTDGELGYKGSDGKLHINCSTLLGEKGSDHWQDSSIASVNKFHNYWTDADEQLGSSGTFAYNVRYTSTESGMVIVNTASTTTVNITVSNMKDGSYTDLVSGNTFTVSSGVVTGTMNFTGIAVLAADTVAGSKALISTTSGSTFTADEMTAVFDVSNATSATITVDGQTYSIKNGAKLTIGSTMEAGNTYTITVTATGLDSNEVVQTFIFEKGESPVSIDRSKIYFINNKSWSNIYAYFYNSADDKKAVWPGTKMTYSHTNSYSEDVYVVDMPDIESWTYVVFSNGLDGNSNQTVDITISENANAYYLDAQESTSKWQIGATVVQVGCSTHSWNSGVITTAATHTAAGEKTYTCTVCGGTKAEPIAALGHDTIETWTKSASKHYHLCTCGVMLDEALHTYNEGIVAVEPTETVAGRKDYTCTVCGYVKNVVIPATSHTHSWNHSTIESTCTEAGYTLHECSTCDEEYKNAYVVPTGHSWNSGSVTTKPTRATTGVYTYICSICEEQKTEIIPALGTSGVYFTNNYSWSTVYIYAFNASANAGAWPGITMTYSHLNDQNQQVFYANVDVSVYTTIIFNNGSDQTVDITADQTTTNAYYLKGDSSKYDYGTWTYCPTYVPTSCSHSYGEWVTVVDATDTSNGYKKKTCSICSEVSYEIIAINSHDHEWTSEYAFNSTAHYYECNVCSEKKNVEEHSFHLEDHDGTNYNVCEVCGYEYQVVVNGLKMHYKRTDGDYSKINYIYMWADGLSGKYYQLTNSDSFGRYYTFSYATIEGCDNFGVIIKCHELNDAGTEECWSHRDGSTDKYVKLSDLVVDEDGYYNVYFVSGSDGVYPSISASTAANITYFEIYQDESHYFLKHAFSEAPLSWTITKNGNDYISSGTIASDVNAVDYGSTWLYYDLGTTFPTMSDKYELSATFSKGTGKVTATMWALYDTAEFVSAYGFSGDLGAIYSSASTTFRVWSPIAQAMKLRMYTTGTPASLGGSDSYTDIPMVKGSKGTWEYTMTGDQSGKYYNYIVTNYAFTNQETVDPYAKSTGVNGLRGMVVDFESVNPEGWDELTTLAYDKNSLAVYEAHIADLTSSSTWGGTAANAKKFLGFCETGTTYTEGGTTVTTGFDHIKELGVNAVQLLPIFDGSNDEVNTAYNWGYNPLNYNSLEGAYSSDPTDGYARIREFKQLIKAYNQAGIEIIMDVVFNHVSSLDTSSFNRLMPGYYYRYSGKYPSNGSGCGSETCSERYMMRKFMLDSTEFWSTEYKIGGFRFDLMGVHDVTTMSEIATNLKTKVSPNTVVYGEPWSCGCTTTATLAQYGNYRFFDGFGAFNKSIRDSLMGNTDGTTQAWVAGIGSIDNLNNIQGGIRGFVYGDDDNNENMFAVQYASCHDNYLLYDHFVALGWQDQASIKKAAMLANSVVLMSEGISFFAEGEEFLRTKKTADYDGSYSIHNTYNAPYEANALDYSLKITNDDMIENYKKLIALKKQGIDVTDSSMNTWTGSNTFDYTFTSDGRTYKVIHNNGVNSSLVCNDLNGYKVYLDTRGVYSSGAVLGNSVAICDFQTLIVYQA